MKKLLITALIIAAVAIWWSMRSGVSEHSRVPASLIMGTSADFPPFEYIDEHGVLKGFDIDFIKLLMHELNMPYEIKNMPFDTLLPQAQLGGLHIICSGLSATPERAEHILLSKPYVPTEPVVLIYPKSDWRPQSMQDLVGKHIIINNGYNTDLLLQQYPQIQVVRTPGPAEAMLALQLGKGDGFLIGAFAAQQVLAKQPDMWQLVTLDAPLAPMAIGVSPLYPDLLDILNGAIERLHESGKLAELQRAWGLLS